VHLTAWRDCVLVPSVLFRCSETAGKRPFLPAQETKLRTSSPTIAIRPGNGSPRGRVRLALVVVTLALVGSAAPPAGAQNSPRPDARNVWRQFPLETAHADRVRESEPSEPAPPPPITTERAASERGSLSTPQITAVAVAIALVLAALTGALVYMSPSLSGYGRRRRDNRAERSFRDLLDVSRSEVNGALPAAFRRGKERARSVGAATARVYGRLGADAAQPRARLVTAGPAGATDRAAAGLAMSTEPGQPRRQPKSLVDDQLEILKAKLGKASDEEVEGLKAKLGAAPAQKATAPLRDARRKRQREAPQAKVEVTSSEDVVRIVDAPRKPPARRGSQPGLPGIGRPPKCRIVWWRGYVKSAFQAVPVPGSGGGYPIAESPYFRWRKPEPPPQDEEALPAHRALVERLEEDGWAVVCTGKDWFALELERQPFRRRPGPRTTEAG
jgi:hypothetical protein